MESNGSEANKQPVTPDNVEPAEKEGGESLRDLQIQLEEVLKAQESVGPGPSGFLVDKLEKRIKELENPNWKG